MKIEQLISLKDHTDLSNYSIEELENFVSTIENELSRMIEIKPDLYEVLFKLDNELSRRGKEDAANR